jgi:hypothetical protein
MFVLLQCDMYSARNTVPDGSRAQARTIGLVCQVKTVLAQCLCVHRNLTYWLLRNKQSRLSKHDCPAAASALIPRVYKTMRHSWHWHNVGVPTCAPRHISGLAGILLMPISLKDSYFVRPPCKVAHRQRCWALSPGLMYEVRHRDVTVKAPPIWQGGCFGELLPTACGFLKWPPCEHLYRCSSANYACNCRFN